MTQPAESAVSAHRRRMAARGLARVELKVAKEDVSLLKQVAAALSDPHRRADTRTLIRSRLRPEAGADLKALLASAPIELELERDLDLGRDVEL